MLKNLLSTTCHAALAPVDDAPSASAGVVAEPARAEKHSPSDRGVAPRLSEGAAPVGARAPPAAEDEPLLTCAFYTKPEVLALVGCSYVSLWQWMRKGAFPRGVRLAGGPHIRWIRSEVEAWVANQQRQRLLGDEDAAGQPARLAEGKARKADAETLERKAAAVTRAPRGQGRRRKRA